MTLEQKRKAAEDPNLLANVEESLLRWVKATTQHTDRRGIQTRKQYMAREIEADIRHYVALVATCLVSVGLVGATRYDIDERLGILIA